MAYAVPSDAGLAALANLGLPLIECGAGTGYWASLLRRRGVTVAAFDIAPNKTAAMLAAGGGGKGGAPSHNEYHAEVRSLPSPANCQPSLACSCLLCWRDILGCCTAVAIHRVDFCGAGAGVDDSAARRSGGRRRPHRPLRRSLRGAVPVLPAAQVAHGAAVPAELRW